MYKSLIAFWIAFLSSLSSSVWGKSLFFPQKMLTHSAFPKSSDQQNIPSIDGVFYREDLGTWIVWINGERIDSEHAVTSHGWTVVSVNEKEVILSDPYTKKIFIFHVLDTLSLKEKIDPTSMHSLEVPPQKKESQASTKA